MEEAHFHSQSATKITNTHTQLLLKADNYIIHIYIYIKYTCIRVDSLYYSRWTTTSFEWEAENFDILIGRPHRVEQQFMRDTGNDNRQSTV